MLVLHANWTQGGLRLWGESLEACVERNARDVDVADLIHSRDEGGALATAAARGTVQAKAHGFCASGAQLRSALTEAGIVDAEDVLDATPLHMRLPSDAQGPWPSERMARLAAVGEPLGDPTLSDFEVESVRIRAGVEIPVLLRIDADRTRSELECAASLRYWAEVADFIVELLGEQRFIPTLMRARTNGLRAAWQPWLHDDAVRRRVSRLLSAMPPVARAVRDEHEGRPWAILEEALRGIADSFVRRVLHGEQFLDAIDGWSIEADPHVAWLAGLLGSAADVNPPALGGEMLLRDVGQWIGSLDDTVGMRPLHLRLHLHEPALPPEWTGPKTGAEVMWRLSLHIRVAGDETAIGDAEQVWAQSPQVQWIGGHRVERPQELLLKELARASRIFPRIEAALAESTPTGLDLTTSEAYAFLRETKPVLEEAGFDVVAPEWWEQESARLGARLQIDAPELGELPRNPTKTRDGGASGMTLLGLNSLVKYRWQVAVGDQPLTMEEFHALARQSAPLVNVRGKWVEIDPQQLAAAEKFIATSPSGEMTLLQAIQMSHGADAKHLGLPVFGMDASGWVADLLEGSGSETRIVQLEQPSKFLGQLRPYQKTGLSWMSFLDRLGLGACLADDMGLGKTIQLIALLQHERAELTNGATATPSVAVDSAVDEVPANTAVEQTELGVALAPTLLIVPTSVVGNWVRELQRFAPELKVMVHHGSDRLVGDRFAATAIGHDVVITTYPLIGRDHDSVRRVRWRRVALDEAQYIKNPPTKQTMAIRSLNAERRLALTGTPVENRLSELWSIMEFCNPGYLGSAGEFQRRFAVPVERHRDSRRAEQLRQLVRPFILRRVKTDPRVISDLPACVETREFAPLTAEQAALYENVVKRMLGEVEQSEGIQRRGLVLATLIKLKQICNHPAQMLKQTLEGGRLATSPQGASSDDAETADIGNGVVDIAPPITAISELAQRSGKAKRLITMLEEVLATGERALIFTQFRQMGHLLAAMIQHELDCEALFMHGGTPRIKRQHMIDRFQSEQGEAKIFILSLKAGGVGLNLTAANHVFHYDRWWNPAVENQATDRAFRIGQTRTVHVHKFVCLGTLEERIDQMIAQKTELAQNIIGAGEQWLTELSTAQLHELLTLRTSAMEAES